MSSGAIERGQPGKSGVRLFGSQLRRLRVRAGLTQEVLAERAGVSVATIRSIEQGLRRQPHPHTVLVLANGLGLHPADQAALMSLAVESSSQPDAAESASPEPTPVMPGVGLVSLPAPVTALIGREAEVTACTALLDPARSQARLVTLVGPGGVGKTRLAQAVGAAVTSVYADGVIFVDLSPVRESHLVPATIAHALEMLESGGQSAHDLLIERLRDHRILLILDNFEQLLGAAPFLAELLEGCPALALLVTSRTALRLRSERRFPVAPLATPTLEADQSVEAISNSPAVRLFVERAQAFAADFTLTQDNASAVAGVCRRLDGMPLALELAAPRVALLRPQALLQRLERRLALLTNGPADLPERQQTLRTTLGWSYDLLGPIEQVLFRRLSVFAGGWTLEAAEAVCAGSNIPAEEVLDRLTVLVDNSLVQRPFGIETETRFGMLETVREYAAERTLESGEQESLRERHAAWCMTLAEQAASELTGPDQATWLERLDGALDNLRAALNWADEQGQIEPGLRLVGALGRLWSTRRYVGEGREWVERFIARASTINVPAAMHARACYAAGVLANIQGDQMQATLRLEQSIELYHLAGDTVGAVRALNTRGGVAYDQGQLAFAAALWEQSLAQARVAGDLGEAAHAVGNLGEAYFHMGDVAAAAARHIEALALARQAGRADLEAMQLGNLGNVAREEGDLTRATSLQRQALTLKHALGARRQVAITLADLASIAGAEGRATRAARLLGAASAVRELIGTPQPVPERTGTERAVATAKAALGDEAWNAAFVEGRAFAMEQAIAYALE